jgi:hypothetical protein
MISSWLLSAVHSAMFRVDFSDLLAKPGYSEPNLSTIKLGLALVAIVVLIYESLRESEGAPIPLRTKKMVWGGLAVMGVISYFQFFQIGYHDFYHRWEFFHYYVGAKYYRELGYEGIYKCAAIAEYELPGGQMAVRSRKIRDLRKNLIVPTTEFIGHPEECKNNFSAQKWDSFKQDVAFFRQVSMGDYWKNMQTDHGYNPPPVWGMTGWLFSQQAATIKYIKFLSTLDLFLFTGMFGMIAWAFGWRVTCIAIVFWGTQDASPFYWTGGAFLRQDWLFYTIVSACMIRRKKYFWGGAFLTYGTLLRVFPMFFFTGWLVMAVSYAYRHYQKEKDVFSKGLAHAWQKLAHPQLRKVALGALCAGLVLIPASSVVHGVGAWKDFIHHIGVHNGTPVTNHMGWKTIIGHSARGRMQIARDNKLQDPFEKWKNMRKDRVKALRPLYWGGIAAMMALFTYACWRLRNIWVVEALGLLPTSIMVELTCYYYSYFIFGAMLARGRRPIELALMVTALMTEYFHLRYAWIDDRFTAMSIVFLMCAIVIVMMYSRNPWAQKIKEMFKETTKKKTTKPAKAAST